MAMNGLIGCARSLLSLSGRRNRTKVKLQHPECARSYSSPASNLYWKVKSSVNSDNL